MNPLPNRPLLNNSSIPLLPNVPSFDQIPYNGRPRKVLPEASSILNGMGLMSGSSSAPATPAGTQGSSTNAPGLFQHVTMVPQQQQQQQQQQPANHPHQQSIPPQNSGPASSSTAAQLDREKESDSESRQLTAIFRPDDAGEWKERLRLSYEGAEQARSGSWDRRRDDEEEVKDEDGEVEDDDSSVVGEGEGNKVWKAKRTLRKSVVFSSRFHSSSFSHLDAVRALSFHPNELSLATGGDDCTVKIWRMDVTGLASSA